jgi:hypothetical protein
MAPGLHLFFKATAFSARRRAQRTDANDLFRRSPGVRAIAATTEIAAGH